MIIVKVIQVRIQVNQLFQKYIYHRRLIQIKFYQIKQLLLLNIVMKKVQSLQILICD